MENFNSELESRIKRYFKNNTISSVVIFLLPMLFLYFDLSSEMKGWFPIIFLISFLILFAFMVLNFFCMFILRPLINVNFNSVFILYSITPFLAFVSVLFLKGFLIFYFNILPFLIGQIISLFLVLKFIKENKSEQQ